MNAPREYRMSWSKAVRGEVRPQPLDLADVPDAVAQVRDELVGAGRLADGDGRPALEREHHEVVFLDAAAERPHLPDVVGDLPARSVRVQFAVQVGERLPVRDGREVGELVPADRDDAFLDRRLLGIAVLPGPYQPHGHGPLPADPTLHPDAARSQVPRLRRCDRHRIMNCGCNAYPTTLVPG
jgi:hypothetical protein